MAMIIHPIAWFLKTLRQWREWERQVLVDAPRDDALMRDLYHGRNVSFWYLPPPC